MFLDTFKYRRGSKPDWLLEKELLPSYPEALKTLWKDDEIFNGVVVSLDNPMGCFMSVSLFDGEVIITLQFAGGHKLADPTISILRVDNGVELVKVVGDPMEQFKKTIGSVNFNALSELEKRKIL